MRSRTTVLLLLGLFSVLASGIDAATKTNSTSTAKTSSSVANATAVSTNSTAKATVTTTTNSSSSSSNSGATAIDQPSPGSTTFRLVNPYNCDKNVIENAQLFYSRNRDLFVACVSDSGYQIFPYTGTVPTAADTAAIVHSAACMKVLTAVVLRDPPACTIGEMPIKAGAEVLVKISVDMANDSAAPTPQRFQSLLNWRRDVNLAAEAGLPCDSNSELYAEFTANLKAALLNSTVTVSSELVIRTGSSSGSEVGTLTFSNGTGSSLSAAAGTVSGASESGSASSGSAKATYTLSSNALRSAGHMTSRLAGALVMAAAVWAL